MLAFVLTDFFKSGTSAFGGSKNVVGEIAGEKVQYDDLMKGVEELKVMYQGSDFDEASLREQAWNQIIQERVIKKQHELLGIEMGRAEIIDALFGSGISREVTGLLAELIDYINTTVGTVVAVDLKSGLFA